MAMAQSGQVNIPRIELMGNEPTPYLMRNWAQVAKQYDAFVYDVTKTGQYLPFIKITNGGVNYPQDEKFTMSTYVGSPGGNEAINVLPSLVGASLMSIDKTNQFGKNWVKMSYDFFNKANGENIYLNNAGASSGGDWWYDIMPNVYFYQLYDLYPGLGAEADVQFLSIANTFTQAIKAMGGQDAPWQKPFMNYRAWKFKTMTPNASGVPEPESAGSMAWVLYNAYQKTGNKEYLKASEWAMEFLNEWPNNPSYELQLPYGAYTAARMNAELNTNYDVNKMINWCFDKGSLRGWGAIKGKWGGIDVSGLIGEANDGGNDYAFQMNGLHQAAALVPMVRYDKRFARAIGKWILHLANANRLFYNSFLPSDRQDATVWSTANDTENVIGYEALKEVWQGKSPFSTGDALKGGWAPTNLALYGTSSIGYLGSIVETTNVEKVLKLDLNKTDFFNKVSYPSYLFYNPNTTNAEVSFSVGNINTDIFEALTEKFIHKEVSGTISLSIPAGEALSIVVCPANGTIRYNKNKMYVDDIVVDYQQHSQAYTFSPRIKSLASEKNPLEVNKKTMLHCTAEDRDSPGVTYKWTTTQGTILGSGKSVEYTAPATPTSSEIQCITVDPQGNSDTSTITVSIVSKINNAPSIIKIDKGKGFGSVDEKLILKCIAEDADGDALTYEWKADSGLIENNGDEILWSSTTNGIYKISVTVTDSEGAKASTTTNLLVKSFDNEIQKPIAYYPFTGNTNDASTNALHGQAKGVILNSDKDGIAASAYYFNGGAQHIIVPNDAKLNVTEGISICAWIKPTGNPEKETFILSHGSWQNRWKLSVTPDRYLRWTINTTSGIADLDAISLLKNDEYTHVCASYDQDIMSLYINGNLESYKNKSGLIRTTNFPFLMGQMLPDDANYNFKGTMDEVVIFGKAINPDQTTNIYASGVTTIKELNSKAFNSSVKVHPNPANESCTLALQEQIDLSKIILISASGQSLNMPFNKINNYNYEIELRAVNAGLFTFMLFSNDKIYSTRLIKI